MTKNPFLNAASAAGYIILVVLVINFLTQTLSDKPDTFFAPVVLLCMLTLSAAVMAFIFFYQPLVLLTDGKKKASLQLFSQTIGVFAVLTVVALALLFTGLI